VFEKILRYFSEQQFCLSKSPRRYIISSKCLCLCVGNYKRYIVRVILLVGGAIEAKRWLRRLVNSRSSDPIATSFPCLYLVSIVFSPPDTLPSLDLQCDRYLIPYRIMSFLRCFISWKSEGKVRFVKLCYLVGKLVKVLMLQEYVRNFDGLKVY